jgi:hypothetical protein
LALFLFFSRFAGHAPTTTTTRQKKARQPQKQQPQVATDALVEMERAMARDGIAVNDRQLACARAGSAEGKSYLAAMSAAANYAWVNRSSMTFLARQAFAKVFGGQPDDLDMHVVYDVSHNIAKVEQHEAQGPPSSAAGGGGSGAGRAAGGGNRPQRLLVHRKGATRAFPPHHPLIPVDYQLTGQPVLIGGTMVRTGNEGFASFFFPSRVVVAVVVVVVLDPPNPTPKQPPSRKHTK